MISRPRPSQVDDKTQKLRALRLAHEAASKDAGTWGEVTVGELRHEASRSIFVQTWKGLHRPEPGREGAVRRPGVSAEDWTAMVNWVTALRALGFSETVVARNLSLAEARRIAQARIAEHQAAGYKVINPAAAPQ